MRRIGLIGIVFAAGATCAGSAGAATIAVTTTADDPTASASACSLTEAILAANRDVAVGGCPAGDLGATNDIVLAAGSTYTVTQPDPDGLSGSEDRGSWYGPNGLPAIASSIVIDGNGATIARSTAAGTPAFRFFYVGANPLGGDTSPGAGSLTLRDLTLEGGFATGGDGFGGGGGGAGLGGAIFNQGSLSLDAVTITGNHAQGGAGGAALAAGGGGGGIGQSASAGAGGGMGIGAIGAAGGTGTGVLTGGGGGGGGLAGTENGASGVLTVGGSGGGNRSGNGGGGGNAAAGGGVGGSGGDGSGGGGGSPATGTGAAGGGFGAGGAAAVSGGGGGGGVGGGGGGGGGTAGAGGGGLGGGGGGAVSGTGGDGGFAGGGGGAAAVAGIGGWGGGGGTSAGGGGGGGLGGAVFNDQGSVTVSDSTFEGNGAVGGGAGGASAGPGIGAGGAIFNLNGSVSLVNTTLASNGGGGLYGLGADDATARIASATLTNSILWGSSGGSDLEGEEPVNDPPGSALTNISAATVDASAPNIVGASSGNGTLAGTPSTADPVLGGLAFNGGPGMSTMALGSGSAAIGTGQLSACPSADERGATPPAGVCDLGAYLVSPPAITATSATAAGSTGATVTVDVNPETQDTSVLARYGSTTSYGKVLPNQDAGSGSAPRSLRFRVAGLLPDTTYHAQVLASNADGTTEGADVSFTTPRAGGGGGGPRAPKLTKLTESARRWVEHRSGKHKSKLPVGTRFAFRLNEAATVTFSFKRHKLTRTVQLRGRAGDNELRFSGHVPGHRSLTPGRYTVTVTATSRSGARSKRVTLSFTIVRP